LLGLEPVPSLVISGQRATDKYFRPQQQLIQNPFHSKVPFGIPMPITQIPPMNLKPIVPSQILPHRFQPYFSKTTNAVPVNTSNAVLVNHVDGNKFGFNAAGLNGFVQPTTRPPLPQFSAVLFSDALQKKKNFPSMNNASTVKSVLNCKYECINSTYLNCM